MALYFWLIVICAILAILYVEKSYRLKKMKKMFTKMEHKFFKQQQHKERYLAEVTKKDVAENVTLDSLTKLPDSQVFTDRLSQAVNQSKRHKMSFAVMLVDLTNFSSLNEELGHDLGDKVLIEAAKRLKNIIRQVDTISRKGNNFVFLLPLLSKPETAAYVAQRAQDAIMQSFEIDGKKLSISANIGIAIYPADGDDATTLLKNAESAAQQAKINKKNTYQFFKKELQILGQRELSLTATLRSPEITQHLLVRYQPHINVETNEISCVQSILYLQHPEYGLIAFSDFFKLAENAGRIIEIGEWFLDTVLHQFQQWEVEDFKPPLLSINVSMKQIENPRFLVKLTELLQKTGLDPNKIMIDISENLFTENSEAVESGFSMLTRMGVKICIGIFTLGHFAVSKISKIPIDYLKIDGKLIQDVLSHHENENILGMIISLAKDSQIIVVADGVEHTKQKTLLKQLGCTIMQGKLFGLPQPANTLENEYHNNVE